MRHIWQFVFIASYRYISKLLRRSEELAGKAIADGKMPNIC